MIHTWTKDYIKENGHNVEQVLLLISESGGIGNSNLMKVIYIIPQHGYCFTIAKSLENLILLLEPAGISAVNIYRHATHSGLGIRSGTKLLELNLKI